jgi:transcriptional regulator with XRE-family HTH domain
MSKRTADHLPMLDLLKDRNITLQQLADTAGVSLRSVQNWLSGTHEPRLYLDKTEAVCDLLELPLKEVVDLFRPVQIESPPSADSDEGLESHP